MTFNSTSQAGQDRWAWEMCGRKTSGFFADLGSYHLLMSNNSYSLELLGWRGLCCDIHKDEENLPKRTAHFVHGDARNVDWLKEIDAAGLPRTIDYLSLDVDDATLETLERMPLNELRFGVATIETDAYVYGNGRRDRMREILNSFGYEVICADVMIRYPADELVCFEDWYANKELSETPLANKLRCEGVEWSEIIKRIVP